MLPLLALVFDQTATHVIHLQDVPGMVPHFMDSPYDWGYSLKRRPDIAGAFKDRRLPYPRGMSLGGSR